MKIPDTIKSQILAILFKYLNKDTCTVFVFGSYAERNATQASDIDIGIMCNDKNSLSEILRIKSELNENVVTLRDIDLVDFNSDLDEKFKQIALKEVIVWHQGKESRANLSNTQKL